MSYAERGSGSSSFLTSLIISVCYKAGGGYHMFDAVSIKFMQAPAIDLCVGIALSMILVDIPLRVL